MTHTPFEFACGCSGAEVTNPYVGPQDGSRLFQFQSCSGPAFNDADFAIRLYAALDRERIEYSEALNIVVVPDGDLEMPTPLYTPRPDLSSEFYYATISPALKDLTIF